MSYRIAQDSEFVGNGYWRWWAWIEGEEAEMNKVKQVVWILHPSFKRTRVTIEDRSNGFQLKTAGWGTFLLRAEVILVDGAKRLLNHKLKLKDPEPAAATAPTRAEATRRSPTLFLSYSTQDSRTATKVRENFKKLGYQVFDQTVVSAGEPWKEALQRMISQSDAVIGLVGEDEISPWVSEEIEAAVAVGKPVCVLLPPGASGVGIPSSVRTLQVDLNQFDPSTIAEVIRFEKSD